MISLSLLLLLVPLGRVDCERREEKNKEKEQILAGDTRDRILTTIMTTVKIRMRSASSLPPVPCSTSSPDVQQRKPGRWSEQGGRTDLLLVSPSVTI